MWHRWKIPTCLLPCDVVGGPVGPLSEDGLSTMAARPLHVSIGSGSTPTAVRGHRTQLLL